MLCCFRRFFFGNKFACSQKESGISGSGVDGDQKSLRESAHFRSRAGSVMFVRISGTGYPKIFNFGGFFFG